MVNTPASADIASTRGHRGPPRASGVRRSSLTPPRAFKLLKETSFCSEANPLRVCRATNSGGGGSTHNCYNLKRGSGECGKHRLIQRPSVHLPHKNKKRASSVYAMKGTKLFWATSVGLDIKVQTWEEKKSAVKTTNSSCFYLKQHLFFFPFSNFSKY